MFTVAIIPARGGSKRIPRKNLKPFCGKPMISYSIAAARASGLFDRIIVSTDDADIAALAKSDGAEVPFLRPSELADDQAGTDVVLVHALRWFAAQGTPADYGCCLYATAPFVTADDLRRGFATLRDTGAITAFSVTSFAYPIFRALKLNERGCVEMFWPENFPKRSQDLPEAFHDAGQFYWLHVAEYLNESRLFSSNSRPVFMPRYRVQDIDTQEDWDRAERMFELLQNHMPPIDARSSGA